jgi:hypothetical protein
MTDFVVVYTGLSIKSVRHCSEKNSVGNPREDGHGFDAGLNLVIFRQGTLNR